MKEIRWNIEKNERLKYLRGASFEDLINKAELLSVKKNPSRNNQSIMLFYYKKYIWIVPFIEEADYIFLKTLFPSRKYTKHYKGENL